MRALVKVLYGVLFAAVLPAALVVWTAKAAPAVPLPAIRSLPIGVTVALFGLLLMLLAMSALWRIGGGLPMNAFPPPNLVSQEIYRFISHPIYVGFVLVCAGVAVAIGSASGLWLTTPAVALTSAALVLGYELPDMRRRFGNALQNRLLLENDSAALSLTDRFRCYLIVFLPWIIFYEAMVYLGIPQDAIVANLPFEFRLPVYQWSEAFYFSIYPVALLVPVLVDSRAVLRQFCLRALVSMLIVFPIYLCIPLISPPRILIPDSLWGRLLMLERSLDSAAAAFPSYHVIWAFLAAEALGAKGEWRKLAWRSWAILVSVSCVTTGMHACIDVLAGFLTALLLIHITEVWEWLRGASERIANSWQEWRVGPLRIINHGAYAAAGVFVGILIIATCLGPGGDAIAISIFVGGTIAAALWAQFIEGSPALLRPLGFYGGLLGTITGAILAAKWTHTSIWLALAGLSVAAPWIQGLGRLRCLVQGCCHGRLTTPEIGIRYSHPRSRVSRIPEICGLPIHATPLYSILWNALTAMFITRLYLLHVNSAMVGGIYLILSGSGRFVEEGYRGEPQTPIFWRLRLYQWMAIVTVIAGAIVTCFTSAPVPPSPRFHFPSLAIAFSCALLAWFVTGVDFPASNRRFARLA